MRSFYGARHESLCGALPFLSLSPKMCYKSEDR